VGGGGAWVKVKWKKEDGKEKGGGKEVQREGGEKAKKKGRGGVIKRRQDRADGFCLLYCFAMS
jgi:hypothetical protein